MLSTKGKEKIHMWVFLALPVLYFLLHAFWGYDNTDQGFIQGISWRILKGELIYQDFDYVRPPLSPYLHALFIGVFPKWGAVLLSRLVFYLMMAASVWFTVAAINQRVALRMFSTYAWLIACIGFILSVHNYPPMPWHTVDGIFFASLGIFLIGKSNTWWILVLGSLSCVLSAMTKQSFYPVPMIGIMAAFIFWNWKKGLVTMMAVMAFVMMIFGGMMGLGIWDAFLQQTTGSSTMHDLFQAGIMSYAKPMLVAMPLMMMPMIWNKMYKGTSLKNLGGWMFWAGMAMLWMANVYRSFSEGISTGTHFGWSQALFIIGMMAGMMGWMKMGRSFFILPAMVMVAWCAGISWGMQTPVLFITPAIVGVVAFTWMMGGFLPPKWFYPALIVTAGMIFNLLYLFPYRSAPVWECNYSLGEEIPQLAGIRVDKQTADKHKELIAFRASNSQGFTILPAMNSAEWFLGKKPDFRTTWAHNGEMDLKDPSRINTYYAALPELVLIEKDRLEEIQKEGKYGSIIAQLVMEQGQQLEEMEHFILYRTNPTK